MLVQDIMTRDPLCCTPDTRLHEVARQMLVSNFGAMPVVLNHEKRHVVGILTDRDITCRVVATGKNPQELTVQNCMTVGCSTATPEMSVEECCQIMSDKQVRRVPVVDTDNACCGIVTVTDLTRYNLDTETLHVLKQLSKRK